MLRIIFAESFFVEGFFWKTVCKKECCSLKCSSKEEFQNKQIRGRARHLLRVLSSFLRPEPFLVNLSAFLHCSCSFVCLCILPFVVVSGTNMYHHSLLGWIFLGPVFVLSHEKPRRKSKGNMKNTKEITLFQTKLLEEKFHSLKKFFLRTGHYNDFCQNFAK